MFIASAGCCAIMKCFVMLSKCYFNVLECCYVLVDALLWLSGD